MKAIVLTNANLNSMTAGVGLIVALGAGCYLWGDVNPTKTDIINVKGYYTPDNIYHPVTKGKVSIGKNIKTTLDPEPTPPTGTPTDPPVTLSYPDEIMNRWVIGTTTTGEPIYSEWVIYRKAT
jgi:hypothetical protein